MAYTHYLLITVVLVLSGCAKYVNVDYDKHVNFRTLNTYQIQYHPVQVTQDPRLNSPLIYDRLQRVIDFNLHHKGFTKQAQKTVDFQVKYHLGVKHKQESDPSGVTLGFGHFGRHSGAGFGFNVPYEETHYYESVVLTIDILTPSGQLLWRGASERRLLDGATPESNDTLIFELTTEILDEFPPVPGQA